VIREAITKLLAGNDLTEDEAAGVMGEIMDREATPAQIAAYLVALRCKGETVDELVGSVRCMREHALQVELGDMDAIDLCGTGGDGKLTFNISTTCAFVVAGAGVKVAKHGNRAASSRCGSADLLEELGVAIQLPPVHVARCITEVGLGFMFAPAYHPAMKNVAPVRRELGVRTIFNVLGPLANPAGVDRQLIGVFDPGLLEDVAYTLKGLGTESAVVVHGGDGFDEATTISENEVAALRSGQVTTYTVEPGELGFDRAQPDALRGGTPKENADITLRILSDESGPRADTVLLNSGLALLAAGEAEELTDGIALARESLESGRAKKVLEELVELSQSLAREKA
jgi:anthranilate phosphoribosyltransferase